MYNKNCSVLQVDTHYTWKDKKYKIKNSTDDIEIKAIKCSGNKT